MKSSNKVYAPSDIPDDMLEYWNAPPWKPDNVQSLYDTSQVIGSGTYGVVSQGFCKTNKIEVALKELIALPGEGGFGVAALREIQILKQCDHPNIVRLLNVVSSHAFYDVSNPLSISIPDGETLNMEKKDLAPAFHQGRVSLVFEYLPLDLEKLISSYGKLDGEMVQHFSYQLFRGLSYLHSQNILHRDIKPANILINYDGDLKIADFGLAKKTISLNRRMRSTPGVCTRYYRAPEVLMLGMQDANNLSHQSLWRYDDKIDVWASGCVVGEMALGSSFFFSKDENELYEKIVNLCGPITTYPPPQDYEQKYPFYKNLPEKLKHIKSDRSLVSSLSKKGVDSLLIDLLNALLVIDPNGRLTANDTLKNVFFQQFDMNRQLFKTKFAEKVRSSYRKSLIKTNNSRKQNRRKEQGNFGGPPKRHRIEEPIVAPPPVVQPVAFDVNELDYGMD